MIQRVDFEVISPHQKEAERSGLCFAKNTIYFANFKENILTGFIGALVYPKKIIIKNIYVLGDHRGKGHFKKMLDFILSNYPECRIFEATCTTMSLTEFLRRGFKVSRRYKQYTKVVLSR
jgi:GNAT superfamily N-acetyltransferase